MRLRWFSAILAVFIGCFLVVSVSVFAANFAVYNETGTLNAGDNVLVNFTINETDAAIVQVNFTLPSGFTYYGGGAGTTSTGTFSPSPVVRWHNQSVANIVANGGDQKFWFKVTTPSSGAFPSTHPFNITTTDAVGGFKSANISFTVADEDAPKFSANFSTPATPEDYVYNRSYYFNITWTDNVFLDDVIFEWDSTTNYTNTSSPNIQSLGSGKYSINLTDFAQGNYTYKWYAGDQDDIYNTTDTYFFNVTRGDNPILIYFNGVSGRDVIMNYGESINVTANGTGVTLYKNGSAVSNPFYDVLPRAYYKFNANSTGNYNYTINTTGSTQYINVIYPAPKWTASTDIPSTWAWNTIISINYTWTDENDANGFSVAFIEHNYTGTYVNYTMDRISGTSTSTYQLNVTEPTTLSWKIFANNSYNSWNATPGTNSSISKINPTITLTPSPSWNIVKGAQTSVFCTSPQVDVILYRDGTVVSNPDIQTFGTGSYFYWCNSTATINYSAASTSKLLNVYKYMAELSFLSAENVVPVIQNSSNATTVVVKNLGNATQSMTFSVQNITSSWYTVNATESSIGVSQTAAFLVNFTDDGTAEVKDYDGSYKVTASGLTSIFNFSLRITPKEDDYSSIESSVDAQRLDVLRVWAEINVSISDPDINASSAEQLILQAKEKLDLAQQYIDSGDYFSAYQLVSEIKALVASANTELETAKTVAGVTEPKQKLLLFSNLPKWARWTLIIVGVVVVLVLVYLFWPQSGYSPRTGKYKHKTAKQKGVEKLSGAKNKIKSKIPITKPPSYKPKKSGISMPASVKKKLKISKKEEVHLSDLTPKPPSFDITQTKQTELKEKTKAKKTGGLKGKLLGVFSKTKKHEPAEIDLGAKQSDYPGQPTEAFKTKSKKQKKKKADSNDYVELDEKHFEKK